MFIQQRNVRSSGEVFQQIPRRPIITWSHAHMCMHVVTKGSTCACIEDGFYAVFNLYIIMQDRISRNVELI